MPLNNKIVNAILALLAVVLLALCISSVVGETKRQQRPHTMMKE